VSMVAAPPAKPLLRGMLHAAGLVAAVVVGAFLIAAVHGARASIAASVFAVSVMVMLAISTLYHRVTWKPKARLWMRRLDHAGIYLLIAGTYTPVGLMSLHGAMQTTVLAIVWGGAVAATAAKFCWVHAPKWLSVVIAVALGWVGVAAMPQLARTAGITAVVLLGVGGLAYTAGAIVYARRKPDPVPAVFGYHELFHALTLAAIACQYVAIAFFVVRAG
jgi:hemolysin III